MVVDRRQFLKKSTVTVVSGTALGTTVGSARDDGKVGEKRQITVAHYLGEKHPFYASLNPWKKRVEERTNISIKEVGGGSLGGPKEMMSLVQDGVAEMATIAAADYGSKLALTNGLNLPATYKATEAGRKRAAERVWKLARGVLYEEEWNNLGLEPMATQNLGPYQAESAKGKIIKLSDWKGRSVRSPGGIMSQTIKALRGSPTQISHGHADAFQRGVIDTNIHPPFASVATDIVQFLEAATRNVHLGAFTQFWTMSQDYFNELAPEVQDTLIEIGSEVAKITPKNELKMRANAIKTFKEKGVERYDVPPKHKKQWNKALMPVKNKWVKQMEKQNLPAGDVLKVWDPSYPYE